MDDQLSTKGMSWILGRSQGSVRDMIRDGELQAARIVSGFRIPKDEALRVARQRVEADAGRKLSDRQLETLIDEVIATNRAATGG